VIGVAIPVGFACSTVGFALVQGAIESRLGAGAVAICLWVIIVWLGWTWWHSVSFGRHRRKYLETAPIPYRRAFFLDLIPGLTLSFSQMLRPALNGDNIGSGHLFLENAINWLGLMRVTVGVLVCVGAALLFASAWRALGTARVGFVPEFVDMKSFVPVRTGPYDRVRHPLFWSGIIGSCGLAIIYGTPVALLIAGVNVGYGFVYNVLEDRRLCLVFGSRYEEYARTLPHIIPARAQSRSAVGPAHRSQDTRHRPWRR
jgi:protein-S-isoprenylcysteine O-methyltransferase Ste14